MKDKIFDLVLQYPLIIVVFIVLIPVVHFAKKMIKDDNKDIRFFKVIGLSFLISSILNLLPSFMYCEKIKEFIVLEIALTIFFPPIAGFVTIVFDKLQTAGVIDSLITWLKNFLTKKT